jgi:hypothetical protein
VSIWIGRRTQQDRRWLWYVVPLNVVATIIVPAWLAFSFVGGSSIALFSSYHDNSSSGYNYTPNGLSLDGNIINNVYPFDEQGRQVKVRLYDQDGKPINLPLQDCATQYGQNNRGDSVSNVFPQTVVQADENGYTDPENCKDSDKANFVPPPAPATTPTTAGTTPTPTPRPSAKASTTPPTPSASSPRPAVTLTVAPTR